MSQEELSYWEWVSKMCERLTIIQLSVNNHKDLSDQDWDIVEQLHEYWWRGDIPFFKTVPDIKAEETIQQGLFEESAKITEPIAKA
jgi:hypothetical protein